MQALLLQVLPHLFIQKRKTNIAAVMIWTLKNLHVMTAAAIAVTVMMIPMTFPLKKLKKALS
ncbi:MAG: hypothetical protein K2F60_01685 [Oscillospiraceae bacterium]|nr:hypothetical protein [Oscillospiraceae bacterium]